MKSLTSDATDSQPVGMVRGQKGKSMKVFSREKFKQAYGEERYLANKGWVDRCNGKPVENSHIGTYFVHDSLCIEVPDNKKQSAPARYKITIECDGTTTTASMEVNGKEVRKAQAKRNPDDKFSWRVGAETAFGRLWGKGEKKEPADGVREVKRVAKVGEWVKIVNKFGYSRETYKNGDIRKVRGLYTALFADDGGWVYLEGETCATHSSEYVVLDGYKPGNAGKEERQEKKARPFKVGDRVVCVEEVCGNKNVVGKHGEIIGKNNFAGLLVEFDVKVDGHNGNGFIKNLRGKNRHCWYCFERALRHE